MKNIPTTLQAPRDAARQIGLSVSRLRQLDAEGLLPAMRDSAGRRFYNPTLVEEFAANRERAARARAEAVSAAYDSL